MKKYYVEENSCCGGAEDIDQTIQDDLDRIETLKNTNKFDNVREFWEEQVKKDRMRRANTAVLYYSVSDVHTLLRRVLDFVNPLTQRDDDTVIHEIRELLNAP